MSRMKLIIPCMDMADGRVVKGVNFSNIKDAGDPVEIAKEYERQGADELVFLDINATLEGRKNNLSAVKTVASFSALPICVGGGISTIEDIETVLASGATKVSINSAAVKNPELIRQASEKFGSKRIVIAIDTATIGGEVDVVISGGKERTHFDPITWAKKCERLGAGSLLVTSHDRDGTRSGYDIDTLEEIASVVNIPVIASGGAGTMDDFAAVFDCGCTGALAASLFHFNEIRIPALKKYLESEGYDVKI